jgi:hypothetical protein
LINDTSPTLQGICDFLGLDADAGEQTLCQTSRRDAKSAPIASMRRVAGLPPVQALVAHLPRSTKAMLKRRTPRQPMAEIRTEVSPATRTWISSQLRDDVAQLRQYLPAPFDGWGIA